MIVVRVYRRVKGKTLDLPVLIQRGDSLTLTAARDALQVAFGGRHGGIVWWEPGEGREGFGFKLYPNSYKKIRRL